MTPQQQAEADSLERDCIEQARRDERERVTGKPWWDQPCTRGQCPGPFNVACCHKPHPDEGLDLDA
jgi:hypothetical protein